MARRGRPRNEETSTAPTEAMYDRILASLKPDREITTSEFLKRAFTFPQIGRIRIEKFAGGTWNFAEGVDNVGPAFNPDDIETYLREKYGPWRYRLLAVVDGQVLTQHLLNLDGWQENEARSVTALPRGPQLTPGSKAVGVGATSELLATARERLEIENTTRLIQGLDRDRHDGPASSVDMTGPMQALTGVFTSMVTMMKDVMTMRTPPAAPESNALTLYLMEEIKFMREQLNKPVPTRDADALTKTITAIDGILDKALGTSLADVIAGAKGVEAPAGWASTISGIIEGFKPHLPDILTYLRASQAQPATILRQQALPFPTPTPATVPAGSRPTTAPVEDEMAKQHAAQINAAFLDVIVLMKDALKSKNHKVIDALLMNPPLQGRVVIDPDVPAAVYATMYKTIDAQFGDLQSEIAAYQDYLRQLEVEEAE